MEDSDDFDSSINLKVKTLGSAKKRQSNEKKTRKNSYNKQDKQHKLECNTEQRNLPRQENGNFKAHKIMYWNFLYICEVCNFH